MSVRLLTIVYEKCSGWSIRRGHAELAFGPDGDVRNVFRDLKNATTLSFKINVLILVTVKGLGYSRHTSKHKNIGFTRTARK